MASSVCLLSATAQSDHSLLFWTLYLYHLSFLCIDTVVLSLCHMPRHAQHIPVVPTSPGPPDPALPRGFHLSLCSWPRLFWMLGLHLNWSCLGWASNLTRKREVSRKHSNSAVLCKVYTVKLYVFLDMLIWSGQTMSRVFCLDIKHGKGQILPLSIVYWSCAFPK